MELRIKTPKPRNEDLESGEESAGASVSPSDFESPLEVIHLGIAEREAARTKKAEKLWFGMVGMLFLTVGMLHSTDTLILFGLICIAMSFR